MQMRRQNAITPIVFRYVPDLKTNLFSPRLGKLPAAEATTGAKEEDRFSTVVSIGCQEWAEAGGYVCTQ